jgi:hypothetical protein
VRRSARRAPSRRRAWGARRASQKSSARLVVHADDAEVGTTGAELMERVVEGYARRMALAGQGLAITALATGMRVARADLLGLGGTGTTRL